MKKDRRWMKSALATSVEVQTLMPWTRSTRRRPEAMAGQMKDITPRGGFVPQKPMALAAR